MQNVHIILIYYYSPMGRNQTEFWEGGKDIVMSRILHYCYLYTYEEQ